MWNPFKKNEEGKGNFAIHLDTKNGEGDDKTKLKDKFFGVGVNMMSKIAMRKIEKMSPKEREKVAQEAFNPKNRDKMLTVMEQMKKAGQISEEQYQMAKQKLGF